MSRTAEDANRALSRTPENRRIYAEQQIDWFYVELLKALWQDNAFTALGHCDRFRVEAGYWRERAAKAERDLAGAHERHLRACAELGPAVFSVEWTHPDGYVAVLRDAAGFIRWVGHGYAVVYWAAHDGAEAAKVLGLEVE